MPHPRGAGRQRLARRPALPVRLLPRPAPPNLRPRASTLIPLIPRHFPVAPFLFPPPRRSPCDSPCDSPLISARKGCFRGAPPLPRLSAFPEAEPGVPPGASLPAPGSHSRSSRSIRRLSPSRCSAGTCPPRLSLRRRAATPEPSPSARRACKSTTVCARKGNLSFPAKRLLFLTKKKGWPGHAPFPQKPQPASRAAGQSREAPAVFKCMRPFFMKALRPASPTPRLPAGSDASRIRRARNPPARRTLPTERSSENRSKETFHEAQASCRPDGSQSFRMRLRPLRAGRGRQRGRRIRRRVWRQRQRRHRRIRRAGLLRHVADFPRAAAARHRFSASAETPRRASPAPAAQTSGSGHRCSRAQASASRNKTPRYKTARSASRRARPQTARRRPGQTRLQTSHGAPRRSGNAPARHAAGRRQTSQASDDASGRARSASARGQTRRRAAAARASSGRRRGASPDHASFRRRLPAHADKTDRRSSGHGFPERASPLMPLPFPRRADNAPDKKMSVVPFRDYGHFLRPSRHKFMNISAPPPRRFPDEPHGMLPGPREILPHGDRHFVPPHGHARRFSGSTDAPSARPRALFRRQGPRYLWKKNFMHQQNTGTSRMTTYRRVI